MRSESDDHMDSFSDDDEEDAGYIDVGFFLLQRTATALILSKFVQESVTEKFETFLDKEDALDIFVYFKETIDGKSIDSKSFFILTFMLCRAQTLRTGTGRERCIKPESSEIKISTGLD